MNVSLHRQLEFPACFYIPAFPDKKLQCNVYKLALHFVTTTEDFDEVNIAMDRVKAMVSYEFSHTVFINESHRALGLDLQELGIDVTFLPEEPLDQIIGIMLYCKLNAVMEHRMELVQLDIASDLGDMVWYQHYSGDALGPFSAHEWWHQSTPIRGNAPGDSQQIMISTKGSWIPYDLAWPAADTARSDTVVHAKFRRDEN